MPLAATLFYIHGVVFEHDKLQIMKWPPNEWCYMKSLQFKGVWVLLNFGTCKICVCIYGYQLKLKDWYDSFGESVVIVISHMIVMTLWRLLDHVNKVLLRCLRVAKMSLQEKIMRNV